MENIKLLSPSEFYKMRRPEYFADSNSIYDVEFPKEQLTFELDKITINQKEAEFETLCRRLAEKLISPNLIPQVGPTGGGDGKTDSETYPVSEDISDRWFIPENGWGNGEKWAFAFSAKKAWKPKAENDIKKIISTEREYTRIFFITNQAPSSRKRKEAEDEFKKKYNIEITILDRVWIIEKVYSNNLIDIVVSSLNLSPVYSSKKVVPGPNDLIRNVRLEEIESNISKENRYSEFDYQRVEDMLESAILSRMLEKPKNEVEGKFDRALRFCKKAKNEKQFMRIYYQRAWTYLFYFDDLTAFLEEFQTFKNYISSYSPISQIELYFNLFNALKGSLRSIPDLSNFEIDIVKETEELYSILDSIILRSELPCSSLVAKTYKILCEITSSIDNLQTQNDYLRELTSIILSGSEFIDFPFFTLKKIIEEIGILFPNEVEFDTLIDTIALISSKRASELEAGETFLKRGLNKLEKGYYKESIVYFGKALFKLAKEERKDALFVTLRGLASAYSEIGLIWASNNCLVLASSIAIRPWYEKGILNYSLYECIKQLAINELFIGRLPIFLTWYELTRVLVDQLNIIKSTEQIHDLDLLDACLAVRFMNTNFEESASFSLLPDLLEKESLWLAQDACFFQLGYTDIVNNEAFKNTGVTSEEDLNNYFSNLANQPFQSQIMYKTDLYAEDKLNISSKILGCTFNINFEKDIELLLGAETLLIFFESFLATSLQDVHPTTESINIEIIKALDQELVSFDSKNSSNSYCMKINNFNFQGESHVMIRNKLFGFTSQILTDNFVFKDTKLYLNNLFEKEEVHERLNFVLEYRNLIFSILGKNPKFLFNMWLDDKSFSTYINKRLEPANYRITENKLDENEPEFNFDKIYHNNRTIDSIIDISLWDKAKWNTFGFSYNNNRHELSILLGFEHYATAKVIFKNWKNRFGTFDKEEKIKITIIKGVNKDNPFWYKVCIGSNIGRKSFNSADIVISTTRIFECHTDSAKNLNDLLNTYNIIKTFRLCPAEIQISQSRITDYIDNGIIKTIIHVRNAWEIGINDPDRVAIKREDQPLIPDNIKNAPVLEILK